jgi:hypothetical protein
VIIIKNLSAYYFVKKGENFRDFRKNFPPPGKKMPATFSSKGKDNDPVKSQKYFLPLDGGGLALWSKI